MSSGASLDLHNRWVRWAQQISPAKPTRLILDALIIKHRLTLTYIEILEQVRAPYLRYSAA